MAAKKTSKNPPPKNHRNGKKENGRFAERTGADRQDHYAAILVEQLRSEFKIVIEHMEGVETRLTKKFSEELGEVKRDISMIKFVLQETRDEMEKMRGELKGEIAEVRTELKQEIGQVRTELKQEIAEVRTELKQEIGQVRDELKLEITKVRSDFKEDIQHLAIDVKANTDAIERIHTRFDNHETRFTALEQQAV